MARRRHTDLLIYAILIVVILAGYGVAFCVVAAEFHRVAAAGWRA